MNTNVNPIGTDGNRNEPSPEITEEIIQILSLDNPVYMDKMGGIYKEKSADIAGIPKELQKVFLQVGELKRSF